MLVIILGTKGSGKTLFSTTRALNSKREVYANYRIDIENYNHLEVMDLVDISNSVDIMIDEAYVWLESRISGFFLNRFLSYMLWQSRKRDIDMYLTAQKFRALDLRFREECDVIVKCKTRINLKKDNFHFSILWIAENKVNNFTLSYKDAEKIFPLYDTYQIIEPYTKEELNFELLKRDPERRWEKAMEIGDVVGKESDKKELTHPVLRARLMKKGYDKSFEPLVYVYLKGFVD
jgi:hypothetical protein